MYYFDFTTFSKTEQNCKTEKRSDWKRSNIFLSTERESWEKLGKSLKNEWDFMGKTAQPLCKMAFNLWKNDNLRNSKRAWDFSSFCIHIRLITLNLLVYSSYFWIKKAPIYRPQCLSCHILWWLITFESLGIKIKLYTSFESAGVWYQWL